MNQQAVPSISVASRFQDFKAITKMGLSLSVVFSSIAGYLLAADQVNYLVLILLAIGGYCMVGASNVFNQIIECDLDKLMLRTQKRPLPTGKISVINAFILGTILTVFGLSVLYYINAKTAMFAAISIFLYTKLCPLDCNYQYKTSGFLKFDKSTVRDLTRHEKPYKTRNGILNLLDNLAPQGLSKNVWKSWN